MPLWYCCIVLLLALLHSSVGGRLVTVLDVCRL